MTRRQTLIIRLLGAVAMAVIGYQSGVVLYPDLQQVPLDIEWLQRITITRWLVSVSFGLFGLAIGYLIAPLVFRPLHATYALLKEVPPERLMGAAIGLALGLFLSTLAALPLSLLPRPFGQILPFVVAVALGYLGVALLASNPGTYLPLVRAAFTGDRRLGGLASQGCVLLDTSVIIDGRIVDVVKTGFLDRTMIVPRFVLGELQQIADSPDVLRRNRGRRGLEVLNELQQLAGARLQITDRDITSVTEVDQKLVQLARNQGCAIMTNDYNLNRVAELQGVQVLNLNELANAVKTLLLPGEQLELHIIQEGKEPGQGVGYLEDGTMVVVEQGRDYLEQTIPVTVTRVLQTVAGRMIFAVPTS